MDAHLHFRLTHALTEYDRKQARSRYHNPYALAHYLGALQDAEALIDAGEGVRRALESCFDDRLLACVLKAAGC